MTRHRRRGGRRGVPGLGKPSELRGLSHSQRLPWKTCRWPPASAGSLQSPERARGPRHSSCANEHEGPVSLPLALPPPCYLPHALPRGAGWPPGTGEEGRDGARPAGRPRGLLLIKARRPHATALITVQYVMLF